MSLRAGVRRVLAGTVLALACACGLWSGWEALDESGIVLEAVRARRRVPYERLLEGMVGREYLASIRRVQAQIDPAQTIYFIDAEERASGAPYFALHYLAPRRLVRVGALRENSLRWLRRHVPPAVEWVVLVDGIGKPLRLARRDELFEGFDAR